MKKEYMMFLAGWIVGFSCGVFMVVLWLNSKLDRR